MLNLKQTFYKIFFSENLAPFKVIVTNIVLSNKTKIWSVREKGNGEERLSVKGLFICLVTVRL